MCRKHCKQCKINEKGGCYSFYTAVAGWYTHNKSKIVLALGRAAKLCSNMSWTSRSPQSHVLSMAAESLATVLRGNKEGLGLVSRVHAIYWPYVHDNTMWGQGVGRKNSVNGIVSRGLIIWTIVWSWPLTPLCLWVRLSVHCLSSFVLFVPVSCLFLRKLKQHT